MWMFKGREYGRQLKFCDLPTTFESSLVARCAWRGFHASLVLGIVYSKYKWFLQVSLSSDVGSMAVVSAQQKAAGGLLSLCFTYSVMVS